MVFSFKKKTHKVFMLRLLSKTNISYKGKNCCLFDKVGNIVCVSDFLPILFFNKPKICIKYRPIQISSKINSSQVSSAILIQIKENVIKHFVDILSGSAGP